MSLSYNSFCFSYGQSALVAILNQADYKLVSFGYTFKDYFLGLSLKLVQW